MSRKLQARRVAVEVSRPQHVVGARVGCGAGRRLGSRGGVCPGARSKCTSGPWWHDAGTLNLNPSFDASRIPP